MEKEELYSKTVVELRVLGREIGVQSPTTMLKKELINSIWQICCGAVEPHRSNMGRPPVPSQKAVAVLTKADVDKIELVLLSAVEEAVQILRDKFSD